MSEYTDGVIFPCMTLIICLQVEKFLWPDSKSVLYLYLMVYDVCDFKNTFSPSEKHANENANVFKENMLENKHSEKAI